MDINHTPPPAKHRIITKDEHSIEYQNWINSHKVCKCQNCGSSIVLNKLDITTSCPYCHTPYVLDRSTLPDLVPDAVIPFRFDHHTAGQKFKNFAKSKFYVNGKFKKDIPDNLIVGTYIPSFVFDAISTTQYSGTLYREEVVETSNGHTTRSVPFHVSGTITVQHQNVLIESSTQLNQKDINGVLPFDYSQAYAFADDYILGYNVEYYNDSLAQSDQNAQPIYEQQIKRAILRKYSQASSMGAMTLKKSFNNHTYSLYLMPVYRFEYQFKKKPYITYMNGQTGKVNNNLPKSGTKITLTVLFVLLLILLPFILAYLL